MFYINYDVIFVSGAKNAAIYNLVTGRVYSLNHDARKAIIDLIHNQIDGTETTLNIISELTKTGLISDDFKPFHVPTKEQSECNLRCAWLELTPSCNLRCIHCYSNTSSHNSENTLSTFEWQDVIEQLSLIGCEEIRFIGGEPTLYPDLVALIEKAIKLNIKIKLYTNGTYFPNNLLHSLHVYNVAVQVSIYGHTSKIHDSITGVSGSLKKLESNIKLMLDLGIKLTCKIVVMKNNEDYINEINRYLSSFNPSLLPIASYDIIRPTNCESDNKYIPTKAEVINSSYLTKPSFNISKKRFFDAIRHNTCWYRKLAIKSYGDIIPCIFERNAVISNVRKQKIADIINSEDIKSYWNLDFSQIENCKDCEFRFACKDCRPLTKATTNNCFAQNPRCLYDPHIGEWKSLEIK